MKLKAGSFRIIIILREDNDKPLARLIKKKGRGLKAIK